MRLPLTEATTDFGDPPAGHRVCGARWGFLFSEGVDYLYPTEDYAANDRRNSRETVRTWHQTADRYETALE